MLSDDEIVDTLEKEGIANQPVIKRTLTKMAKEDILKLDHEITKNIYEPLRIYKTRRTTKYYRLNKEKIERERRMQKRLDEFN